MAILQNSMREERQQARAMRSPEEKQRRFYIHFAVFLAVNIGLCILNMTQNPSHLWFHWVVLGWGIGVIGHAVRAFGLRD